MENSFTLQFQLRTSDEIIVVPRIHQEAFILHC